LQNIFIINDYVMCELVALEDPHIPGNLQKRKKSFVPDSWLQTLTNLLLGAPQGHFQVSGRSSNATPSFSAGLYTYPHTLHLQAAA
jgi:hypothetical protein